MDEENLTYFDYLKKTASFILNIKITVGFILIGIGGYAAFFVISTIKTTLTDPASLQIVKHIAELEPEGILFSVAGTSFTISQTLFTFGLLLILLTIGSSIAYKFVSLGINLVKIEIKGLLDRLWNEWKELRAEEKAEKERARAR